MAVLACLVSTRASGNTAFFPDALRYAVSYDVERQLFSLDDVIANEYEPTYIQGRLFVISSLEFLREQSECLVQRFGMRGGCVGPRIGI